MSNALNLILEFLIYVYFTIIRNVGFWGFGVLRSIANFLQKFTRIVLSVHKFNKLGKFW